MRRVSSFRFHAAAWSGLLLAVGVFGLFSGSASASYNGARLIDDSVFRDSSSMSIAKIQSFLNDLGSGLRDDTYKISCYDADSKERQWYEAAGARCDVRVPASEVIYYAAKIYGVNPKVILATLQKEQSLITTTNPTSWQISQAMGYACPTSGSCSDSSNFSYQIDSGTWVLRYHYERANGNNNWWSPSDGWVCGSAKKYYKPSLYPQQNVTFYDENNVAYRTYKLVNPATSAFYCYTPHAYNNPEGLYGLPRFGTKGQYYSGSYNFVKFYEKWFGSTTSFVKDQAITGDYGLGGEDELGLKRGNTYLYDMDLDGTIDKTFGIGQVTDKAMSADWDGDGKDEIGLRRGNEYFFDTDNDGKAEVAFGIGKTTDQVIVGDWNGDGTANIGLKRGNKYYLDTDNDNSAEIYFGIGQSSDRVIVGDWDGNGRDNIGLKRGNRYFLDTNNNNSADIYIALGQENDKPMVLDWDADGSDELGLKRNNRHYLTNNTSAVQKFVILGYY